MESLDEEKDKGNVYAYNVEDKIIHISEANSGKKGYFCLGCRKEMQAVKFTIANYQSYFRHDPKGVDPTKKCTYSDETHRHKLAKDILQQIMKIKVPPVYKYPPKGQPGLANLLTLDRFINAHTVENETYFFEDANGEIRWGKQKDVGDRFLLIKPDVTFFDKDYQPILFIELVATHKVSQEKLIKMKHLGIDTIQVNIPKGSPKEIEEALFKSEKIKWVYNNEQERTEYLPVSESDAVGVPPADELQRKFFEESYECRAAQIRSFIRGLNKCLAAEPYREIESRIRLEISRVERNTDDHRERLHRLQENHRTAIESTFAEEKAEIATEKAQLSQEKTALRARISEAGADFSRKEEDHNREEASVDRETELLEARIGEEIANLGRNRGDSEIEAAAIDWDIAAADRRIKQIRKDTAGLPAQFAELEKSANLRFADDSERERAAIRRIQEAGKQLPSRLEQDRAGLEARFIGLREQAHTTVTGRNSSGNTELSRRIKGIVFAGGTLENFHEEVRAFKGIKRALECFNSRAYKKWLG